MSQESSANNKRIAKNTMFMYIRMFITMCVGLYTSRVILRVFGVEDYGLYNVVGGIVAMFGFLNNSMANATSRFLTYTLGKGDGEAENQMFSMAIIIHVAIALMIFILGETIGLWYLHNKLVVPEGRMYAAEWLYQLTVLTTMINIMNVPYNAVIIAHERMSAFAFISIMDVLLKLAIVIGLQWVTFDKLITYATLMFGVLLLDRCIYIVYCRKRLSELKFMLYFNRAKFREIFGFAGWNMFGTFSYFFYTQGLNLIINLFCGTAVNAARGIATQVENVVKQFAYNVQTAINPQIIKSYAQNDLQRTHTLIYASTRYSYYLLYLLAFPLALEAPFVLGLWLGDYPDHSVSFLRITLACVILDTFVNPLWTANNATGRIKYYTIVLCSMDIVFMPITYLAIYFTRIPESVFYSFLLLKIIGIIARWFILRRSVGLRIRHYLKEVVLRVFLVSVFSMMASIPLLYLISDSIIGKISIILCSFCISLFCCYEFGITKQERQFAISKLQSWRKKY